MNNKILRKMLSLKISIIKVNNNSMILHNFELILDIY